MRIKDKSMYLWFLPPLALVLLIYLLPICNIVYSAFTGIVGEDRVFVGLQNFRNVLPGLPRTIGLTLVWTLGSILPAMLLGFIAALLFQREYIGKKWMMSICVLPYTIPLVIVATAWMLMYQPNFGLINVLLVQTGVLEKPVSFMSYENAMISVIVARIWRAMPFAFISYYAALRAIPAEYYEAAEVDGANHYQRLLSITIPQLVPITTTTLIVLTVWTFLVFDIIFTMTGGGPANATNIIAVEIYKKTIYSGDTGAAGVLSLIAIIILLLLTLLYWKFFNKGGENT